MVQLKDNRFERTERDIFFEAPYDFGPRNCPIGRVRYSYLIPGVEIGRLGGEIEHNQISVGPSLA